MTDHDHTERDTDSGPVGDDVEDPGWPWTFILLVVAGAIYLLFRFVELGITLLS